MPGFELPSNGAIVSMVSDYIKSDAGQRDMAERGFSTYSREELYAIGQNFLMDIDAAYKSALVQNAASRHARVSASTTNDGLGLLSTSVFRTLPEIKVSISEKSGEAAILIKISEDLLYRPSLETYEWGYHNWIEERKVGKRYRREIQSRRIRQGTGNHTGPGIKDIFALITHGYPRIRHAVSGLWENNPRGADRITYALPQRTGTPFVPDVEAKYKELYPNITIFYPDEWKG